MGVSRSEVEGKSGVKLKMIYAPYAAPRSLGLRLRENLVSNLK